MGITARNDSTNFEIVPAGNHVARCYGMVDIGTVKEEFKGEIKSLHKVRITWELPLELKAFVPEKGEQPYSISKEYTLSMYETAVLRRDLSSWRGKPFSEDEAKAFDITKLLSVPAMLNVTHKISKAGKEYALVSAITPIPKGLVCPPQVNQTFVFSYEDFEDSKFQALPEYLRKRMIDTPEYLNAMGLQPIQQESFSNHPAGDSDLPF